LGLVRHSSRCLAGLIAAFWRNQLRFSFFTPRASSLASPGLRPHLTRQSTHSRFERGSFTACSRRRRRGCGDGVRRTGGYRLHEKISVVRRLGGASLQSRSGYYRAHQLLICRARWVSLNGCRSTSARIGCRCSGGDDSPWYPSIRICRQRQCGDWLPLLEQVKAELMAMNS
jgi:hypothetical protein